MRMRLIIAAVAFGLAASPAPGTAQDVDSRWWPWVGCWQADGAPGDTGLLCVLPSEQTSAVEVVRLDGADVLSREVVWADGARHETERESCTGWEEGRFSEDGRRVYLRSEHTCQGAVQQGSGVLTMVSPSEWLDIRTSGMGGENVAWVQRLWPATVQQIEEAGFEERLASIAPYSHSARMYAASPMDVDDILEAAAVLPAEAVESLVAERADGLDLDAKQLVRMADAGLDERIIDVAVATSFPHRFALNTGPGGADVQQSALDQGSIRRVYVGGGWGSMYDPFYMGVYGRYGYSPYGYGYSPYGYGYSPYGYGGYYGGGYYGYRPTTIVVRPVESSPGGRVVKGRGYTRGGASAGRPSSGAASRGGAAARSGGAAATSGRSGSRGSSTGRTAKRRGGGDF